VDPHDRASKRTVVPLEGGDDVGRQSLVHLHRGLAHWEVVAGEVRQLHRVIEQAGPRGETRAGQVRRGVRQLAWARGALARRPELQARLTRERLARLLGLGRQIRAFEAEITGRVAGHPLLSLPGVEPLEAPKLVGEVGDPARFRTADAFAVFAGAAPIPASSGQVQRMRLNRGGNRQLNRALFTIALVQAGHHPPAKALLARKRAEGSAGEQRCAA
jgi:transposase